MTLNYFQKLIIIYIIFIETKLFMDKKQYGDIKKFLFRQLKKFVLIIFIKYHKFFSFIFFLLKESGKYEINLKLINIYIYI